MRAMREALNTLLGERAFNDITVQQILDRAGVSRATFYAHFRNKDDVLFASFERMVHGLARTLNTPHERQRPRLVPMRELIEHFASAGDVFHSLESLGTYGSPVGLWHGRAGRPHRRPATHIPRSFCSAACPDPSR